MKKGLELKAKGSELRSCIQRKSTDAVKYGITRLQGQPIQIGDEKALSCLLQRIHKEVISQEPL